MSADKWREITALARRIDRDKEHLLYLQEKATCVPSTSYDRERVQNTISNRAGMYSDAAVDLAREIEQLERELRSMQADAKVVIDKLPTGVERRILTLRYLQLLAWEDIADLTGYTVRRVHQLESKVLQSIS